MKIGYFDCFSGASGDMMLGALMDAGVSLRRMREELKKLRLPTVQIKAKKVLKGGISATQAFVEGKHENSPRRSLGKHHRNLKEILKIVEKSGIETEVKDKSIEIFKKIALIEAGIHHTSPEHVHFHELGGLDSVVDIVGTVWGIRELGLEKIYVSKVNTGSGFIKCEHGILPVPAPASIALMKGKPVYSSGVEKELLTPTGAALLSTLGSEFGPMPSIRVERIGYGAGRADLPHPNLLRLMIGTPGSDSGKEKVIVIETNMDDMNPQFYDYLIEKLLAMTVLEVFITPIQMKKNRPGQLLTIICPSEKRESVTRFLFKETTTLGLRWHEEERERADREIISLQTRYGKIRFKVARWEGKIVNVSPEYEDCKQLALKKRVPLKEIFEESKKVSSVIK